MFTALPPAREFKTSTLLSINASSIVLPVAAMEELFISNDDSSSSYANTSKAVVVRKPLVVMRLLEPKRIWHTGSYIFIFIFLFD
jgi:hypothetical protein